MTGANVSVPPWWSRAVFYQVYPRSFCDSNGDGVGDLDGVIAKLDYLELLGVDAIWINPVTVSPMADHGYDVADPRDVDPLFGGIGALDRLIEAAHRRGIKVTMDLVPNHTSSQHPWFQAALAAGPGTAERERYIFRDGTGHRGIHPPNNWVSVFGGPAWTRVVEPDGNPGQWYLHLFDAEQPDLNWDNPEVFDDLEKTLRFWLERGVDGFRIDVAHGMAKPPGLPDMEITDGTLLRISDDDPRFNHEGVHDIHRGIRSVLNDYPDAVSVGEVWVHDNSRFAEYLRSDELHLGFNFRLLQAEFDAAAIRDAIENSLAAVALAGAAADLDIGEPRCRADRHPIRRRRNRAGARSGDGTGDARIAGRGIHLQRRRAGTAQRRFARRGTSGSGVGALRAHPARPRRLPGADAVGAATHPPFGFSDNPDTWLPIPPEWAALTVEKQLDAADSTLSFFRRALELRRSRAEFDGAAIEWLARPRRSGVPVGRRRSGVRAQRRQTADGAARR